MQGTPRCATGQASGLVGGVGDRGALLDTSCELSAVGLPRGALEGFYCQPPRALLKSRPAGLQIPWTGMVSSRAVLESGRKSSHGVRLMSNLCLGYLIISAASCKFPPRPLGLEL